LPEDVIMDPDVSAFATAFRRFLEVMNAAGDTAEEVTELGRVVQDFVGVSLAEVDPVVETFPPHQAIDLDVALEAVRAEEGGRLLGISGPTRGAMESFGDFLLRSHWNFRPGAVSYVRVPTGPASDRRVVSCGVGLVALEGGPVAWLQRAAAPEYGRQHYTLELMSPRPELSERLLQRVQESMATNSVLRGQVVSLQANDFDYHAPGEAVTFLERPSVTADEVILPDGVLDKIVAHVVGIGQHRDALRAAGQHLKRGVLLYGPPGTGKTHVVRHLLSRTPGTTAVLLSGRTLPLLGDASRLARAAQPAIVVLEDCDLIAEERGGNTNAALFETLEALDGLDGDADVTFILTTNRPDLLERALAERPGRVDLAVPIEKPDMGGRRRLLELYANELLAAGHLSSAGIQAAAEQTEGVTASFAKELVRRVVVRAAREGRPPSDDDLASASEEMQSDAELFTRVLLGAADGPLYAESDNAFDDEDFDPRPGLAPGSSFGSPMGLIYQDEP
jgi:predicted AAA+ superfamily ATPase